MPTGTGTSMSLDDLELELRKLPGVRAAGFTERDDVLFVQVHMGSEAFDAAIPFQATRIAYRHSERPVAVELVRWKRPAVVAPDAPAAGAPAPAPTAPAAGGPAPRPVGFTATPAPETAAPEPSDLATYEITDPGTETAPVEATTEDGAVDDGAVDDTDETEAETRIETEATTAEADSLGADTATILVERRVRLLAVLTFPDTDELEVHLTLEGRRTIGRAAASRGLLGAVEATTDAVRAFVPELSFVPSWARTLEATPGQPFLVAVGLIGDEESEARHGLAGGNSPIEAAARATLHALNRTLSTDLQPGS